MDEGVAAFGHTQTTNPAGNGFHDLWLVRTNIDGMLHFDADSGFDTVSGAVQWTPTSVHVQLPLAPPSAGSPTVTVTDEPTDVNAASATNCRSPTERPHGRVAPRGQLHRRRVVSARSGRL